MLLQRVFWLPIALGLCSCQSGGRAVDSAAPEAQQQEASEAASAADALSDPRAATLNAQCLVMRRLDGNGREGRIYLLDICPDEVGPEHYAINIAPPGEPSVTAFFDTIQSFVSTKEAQTYAAQNGIYDLYWEESP